MRGNRLLDYLDHIQQAAVDARGFVEGLAKEDFLADKRTQQAVIMSLIIIGQAATMLPSKKLTANNRNWLCRPRRLCCVPETLSLVSFSRTLYRLETLSSRNRRRRVVGSQDGAATLQEIPHALRVE